MNAPCELLHAFAASCEIRRARPLLGTLVEISACGDSAVAAQAAIEQAFAEVEQIHQLMSYQQADSDVSRLNREAYARAVRVHAHTWRVLRAARLLAEASHGVFDITVASHLAHMGFLQPHADFPVAAARANWRDVMLLPDDSVRFLVSAQIDLSGIAKGYAVDMAIQALQQAGMSSGRVNAGGDMRVFGAQPQILHVRLPHAHTQMLAMHQAENFAAATSAGYYSGVEQDGRELLPIFHPHTQQACASGRSVTVLAKDCMTADALTKVVYANPRGALPLLRSYKARALIVEQDAASCECRVFDSAGGEAYA